MMPPDSATLDELDAAIRRLEDAVALTGAMGIRFALHSVKHRAAVLRKSASREAFRLADEHQGDEK